MRICSPITRHTWQDLCKPLLRDRGAKQINCSAMRLCVSMLRHLSPVLRLPISHWRRRLRSRQLLLRRGRRRNHCNLATHWRRRGEVPRTRWSFLWCPRRKVFWQLRLHRQCRRIEDAGIQAQHVFWHGATCNPWQDWWWKNHRHLGRRKRLRASDHSRAGRFVEASRSFKLPRWSVQLQGCEQVRWRQSPGIASAWVGGRREWPSSPCLLGASRGLHSE